MNHTPTKTLAFTTHTQPHKQKLKELLREYSHHHLTIETTRRLDGTISSMSEVDCARVKREFETRKQQIIHQIVPTGILSDRDQYEREVVPALASEFAKIIREPTKSYTPGI